MPNDYLPLTDAGLLGWSGHFGTTVAAAPEALGLRVDQAEDYAQTQSAYALAYGRAVDPVTRGGSTVFAKNSARQRLIFASRQLVRIIQACPRVSDAQRLALGIPIRTPPSAARRAVPPPEEAPRIDVEAVHGLTMDLRLRDAVGRPRRPADAAGARIDYRLQDPATGRDGPWQWIANTRARRLSITPNGPEARPGLRCWLRARWYTRTQKNGPWSEPACTRLQFGGEGRLLTVASDQ